MDNGDFSKKQGGRRIEIEAETQRIEASPIASVEKSRLETNRWRVIPLS
jgi:hypothetical protein